ncbi:DUF262 domain-containing protein [Flavobacterium sp. TSSA_36]|uniref:DUF262 domain-containing protein n=1 Tax=Flavobacterium sp. TSSA_36 TaxID=3447669 RepID=UPI003F2B20A5
MAKLLYSIQEVFGTYLKETQKFNIPEYQRGYKWNQQQVKQLLDDIHIFSKTKDESHFYCLQNITLFQSEINETHINVVDGQQRLTTTILLLAYLGEKKLLSNKLIYAVRTISNTFIQNCIDNKDEIIECIINSENFTAFEKEQEEDLDFQDVFFMYTAIRTIHDWFTQQNNDKEAFKEVLLKHVKLIVNKVENVNEQELFMNLNAGKVHLDGADLVRAILITRVAKQELEDYDAEDIQDIVKLNQRRTRIGWQLDELNAWWSKAEVKEYFKNFTSVNTGSKESIKFNQDLHPINLLYKIWIETKGKNEITLKAFEESKADEIYQSILKLHRTLKDWFENRKIYHYLGFLFSHKKVKIKEVLKEWGKSQNTRDHFINKWCVSKIEELICTKEESDTIEEAKNHLLGKITDYDTLEKTNWYQSGQLSNILLLLDVITHTKDNEIGNPLPFLNAKYFTNYKEDKEHIFSGTPKELKELTDFCALKNYIESLESEIDFPFSKEDWDSFEIQERENKLNGLKTEIHKKTPINSIGNLVLLHQTINRGYGNDGYRKKRSEILSNTINGLYVRQHTVKVFLKHKSQENLGNWDFDDVRKNADEIAITLEKFFKNKSDV